MTLSIEDAKKIPLDELYEKLGTDERGITSSEALNRLQQYGPNEIPEKKESVILKFLKNFWGPIPWMIEIAAILSIYTDSPYDFAIIIAMLLINAIVRFWEEYKADNAVELLKEKLALKARILRNGEWVDLPAKEIVPGDIVRVRLGDIIPSDIKLINGDYLQVDESVLTGESLPVDKQRLDIAYEGAIVRQGEMNGLTIGTGKNTFFGRTTMLVSEAKTKSHFQKAIVKIGNYLIIFAIVLVTIVFIVSVLRTEEFLTMLQFALVLIVAAIPVALPAVLMVSMAVGAIDLAKKKAIAKKLLAIEELAGMDILCSDKTGTITKNEISITKVEAFENFTESDVILYGILASREENKDPIDDAFFNKSKDLQAVYDDYINYTLVSFKPFDPVAKRTESELKNKEGAVFRASKGAIQMIVSLCENKLEIKDKVEDIGNSLASLGYRALGVAKTDNNGKWHFVGIVGLMDPPREDSAETIQNAIELGVKVKMVTGDHQAIAKEISHGLGMGENIVSASSIIGKNDTETITLVENADGFSEVFPEHKFHIVELLQDRDHIIGMTGDGVNDAPALKKADVGIAVSNATDAAKSAADIVLTEPGLSIIIGATDESRIIFERMKSYATYRIAETIRVLIFLVLTIMIFDFFPISAIMIVLLALLNDLPIMTIAFDNAKPAPTPVRWQMRHVLLIATTLGLVGVFFSFMIFIIGQNVFLLNPQQLQTFIFLKLAVAGHMTIYLTRTEDNHFWRRPLPSKILFYTCESTQVVATIFAAIGIFMEPIGWALAGFIWIYALVAFVTGNFIKVAIVRGLKFRH